MFEKYQIMTTLSGFLCRFRSLSILRHVSGNKLGARHLYDGTSIGMDNYITFREKYNRKWNVDGAIFRNKMTETYSGDDNLVRVKDLKFMLYTTNGNEEDINLIEKMIHGFHSRTTAVGFETNIFGPIVMRMFHYLNKPKDALKIFKDEKFSGFFDHLSSHVILMDLLFKHDMFEEVIEVYKIMRNKQLSFGRFPKSAMVLVFGAYYKLNTLEHYNEALKICRMIIESKNIPLRRGICFLAALALKQNDPNTSLEIIATLMNHDYVNVRCIKALALCEIDKTDDAVSSLKLVLEYDKPDIKKHAFPYDVIEKVKASVEKKGDEQLLNNFNRVSSQLKEQGYLMKKTFDELLCSEVQFAASVDRNLTVLKDAMDKSHDSHKKAVRQLQRPGLAEMV